MRLLTCVLVSTLCVTGALAQIGAGMGAGIGVPHQSPTVEDPCASCSGCNGGHMNCDTCYADLTSPLCMDCNTWCKQCEPCGMSFMVKTACADGCGDDCAAVCAAGPGPDMCGPGSECESCGADIVPFYSGNNETCNDRCARCYGFMDNESCDECIIPCGTCKSKGCNKCQGWEMCNQCYQPDSDERAADAAAEAAAAAANPFAAAAANIGGSGGQVVSMVGVMVVGLTAAFAFVVYKNRSKGSRSEAQKVNTVEGTTYGSVPTQEAELETELVSA